MLLNTNFHTTCVRLTLCVVYAVGVFLEHVHADQTNVLTESLISMVSGVPATETAINTLKGKVTTKQ